MLQMLPSGGLFKGLTRILNSFLQLFDEGSHFSFKLECESSLA